MNERAMPKPNCTEEVDVGTIEFGRLGRRVVEGRFDGGSMTSDGGVMLLGQLDRKLGLLDAAARCIADPRSPLLIKHAVRDMLRQRVYGLALGWEDLNDHGALRQDVAMQTAVGVDREVASAPTLCRLEKWADRATAWRLHQVLVDQFIASFETVPEELVLDFDATDNPLHGQQEGRFFHGYYDSYCYLPLYVFCGQQLLCASSSVATRGFAVSASSTGANAQACTTSSGWHATHAWRRRSSTRNWR
jgi:Transposase DDE domain group 1